VSDEKVRTTIVSYLYKADNVYDKRVAKLADVNLQQAKVLAEGYRD
jgi:catalase